MTLEATCCEVTFQPTKSNEKIKHKKTQCEIKETNTFKVLK